MNLTEYVGFFWLSTTNTWQESRRNTFIYDGNGHETENIYYDWLSGNWQPTFRQTQVYNSEGFLIEFTNYIWNLLPGEWLQTSKTTYTFDNNNNLTEVINWQWSSAVNDWLYYSKNVNAFDASNKQTTTTTYYWNTNTQDWMEQFQTQSTYDADNNLLENIFYDPGPNNELVLARKQHFYWSPYTIVGINDLEVLSCSVYPNPAINVLHVDGLQQPAKGMIYSTQGNLVQMHTLSTGTSQLNVQQLPAGAYFLHLDVNGKTIVRQFIKQ